MSWYDCKDFLNQSYIKWNTSHISMYYNLLRNNDDDDDNNKLNIGAPSLLFV